MAHTKHKLIVHKKETSWFGVRVRQEVEDMLDAESLHVIQSNLTTQLSKMKSRNGTKASYYYKAKIEYEFTEKEVLFVFYECSKTAKLILQVYKNHI